MQVAFKHTGMIAEASIQVDGLTVIAGENDTGKSTLGKLIFSIIKTFNRYGADIRSYRGRQIRDLIGDYYRQFQRNVGNPEEREKGKTFFDIFETEILTWLSQENPDREEIEKKVARHVESFSETLQNIFGTGIDRRGFIDKIVTVVLAVPGKEDIFKRTFRNYTFSVLGGEIANKYSKDRAFSITGKEGKTDLFEITGTADELTVSLTGELYFKDATFIESPVLLNIADTIRLARTEFDMNGEAQKTAELIDKGYVPEYMRDFIMKVTTRLPVQENAPVDNDIRDMIRGTFSYDPEERDFVFSKDEHTYKGAAIASGIKYLGIISILLQAGFLNKNTLLVFDEPENHLHPDWQVKAARVLVDAVKRGGNILLTSHSPYLIEALKVFSAKYLEKERVSFYLSSGDPLGHTSTVSNVNHDISQIFTLLAGPFRELEKFDGADME